MDSDARSREQALIAVVRELVRELQPQRLKSHDVTLASRLDRDLGIDSLGRTELTLRIERTFRARLSIDVMAESETVGDLLIALDKAGAGAATAGAAIAPAAVDARPMVSAASGATTLIEMLEWHVERNPDRTHVTVLQDDVTVLGEFTYRALAEAGRAVARGLIARDIVPGDRVALMLPTSTDFFAAFYGILYAGAVPVPIYPPVRLSQIEEHLRRQVVILRNAGVRILITVQEGRALAGLLRSQVETMRSVETVATLSTETKAVPLPPAKDPEAIGFIQYTSGSTGDPKGVVLSHANLLANVRSIGGAMDADSSDTFVSWLPLYHDMGLIGAWMGCLYYGARLYVMSPLSFLVRPESWLKAIHRYRATLSGGPNFAYELCVNKIDDATLEGLDLSTLRMVVDGAEPVSAQTLRRFNERFARYGLGPGVVAPCYGLAENCVGLAFPRPGSLPVVDRVNREALTQRGHAEPADPNDPHALEIVYCGAPIPNNEVRIVDEAGRELGERREGRLEFRGPSMTRGYFQNQEKTRELYRNAGWVNSGDRAYMANGDIYITGRVKDIIIIAGRNIYPQEIESALGNLDGMRKGGVAAFGTTDAASGTEKLVVLAETRESDPQARESLLARAHEMVADITGTAAEKIVLVAPQTVPKTSSGKVRRSTAREMYESGNLSPRRHAMWLQVARMAASSAGPTLRRALRGAGETLYALWWWLVVGCGFLAAWFAAMLLPSLQARWAFIRRLARGALRLLGVPLSASGIERIPQGAAVLVFNHASYADAIVLAAVLPGEPAFVAKGEFTQQLFAGPFLRRLGIHFVERYDVAASRADAESAVDMAKGGRSFVFFPEGTFTRRAGLLGFYFGAFKVAAEAGLPVVPGAIRGTREMLRGEQWFARRTPVSVEIGEPIKPTGADFASVLALRDKARAAILARVGEPDLGDLEKPPQAA